MKAEFQKLVTLYEEWEEAGETATLTLSTRGGKSTIKLQLESSPSSSPPVTSATAHTLQPAPGRRRRRRGVRARARRNQRAAAHQNSQVEAATSASLDPPSSRPLRLLPSPLPESGRRRVMSCVGRLDVPTFSNLDGAPPPSPPPPLCQLDGVKPLASTPPVLPPSSPAPLSNNPPQPQPCSPLPPPCFPDPHPLCCHCTGTCPCSWGAPCRRCPERTGRHHVCEWCPGSWCKWAPINHLSQIRSPRRKHIPQHLLDQPMTYNDKY